MDGPSPRPPGTGVSPGQLHSDLTYEISCSEGQSYPYETGWEDCRGYRVLIGHPTYAYVSEVVDNRVAIFDEDPDEAFHTAFGALFGDSALVEHAGGHGDARAMTLVLRETNRENMGNGAERVQLPDNAVAVYDDVEGKLCVGRLPDLSSSAGVLGLDGTPTLRTWEGRLGCPPDQRLHHERVLCDACRQRYLTESLGYRVYQTTTHVEPYSSGRNLHTEKDLALVEAVYRETGHEPAILTTKVAEQAMESEWSSCNEGVPENVWNDTR